jgi:hypothetical protein
MPLAVTGWNTGTFRKQMIVPLIQRALVHAWSKTFILGAAWFLLSLSFVSARGQQQEPIETLKIDTKLVSVPVIVSDRAGHYVPGLRAPDFKLYDNNVQQKMCSSTPGKSRSM